MSIRVLLTGCAGFIGSHFVEAILKTTNWQIVGLDRIDETSTLQRVLETDAFKEHRDRFQFVWHDLRSPINKTIERAIGKVDIVLHLAASTHVDRSIVDPAGFVLDNVLGTCHLLEWARSNARMSSALGMIPKIINFSTDEVFGSASEGVAFTEDDRFHPGNPYSATKAAAIALCDAYHNTYELAIMTTICMNVIGERQHVEKAVPLFTRQILLGEQLLIHSDPTRTKPARRSYIHARNVWNAVRFIIQCGVDGEHYNIVGDHEIDCLELAQMIGAILEKPVNYRLVDFHSDRPGHDLRYALDGRLLKSMGFHQPITFEESLIRTVKWFAANPKWLGL
jgi:dTDP-glucose 4,6-dehydratase